MPRPPKTLSKAELKTARGRFAAHLAALLKQRGWDHHQFAERLGLSEQTVRKWLRADGMPAIESLRKVGEALDCKAHPLKDYRLILPE